MKEIETVRIDQIGFLNGDDLADSVGRLGQSALRSGVSSAATAALVRLTCQAHGVQVTGLSRDYLDVHLEELHSLRLVYWTGGSSLKMV